MSLAIAMPSGSNTQTPTDLLGSERMKSLVTNSRSKFDLIQQIGRELGVRYVIEGSVRRITNQVQVNVQRLTSVGFPL